nr:HemK family protein methyltransferase [Gammaproteobacteria bacterium]
MSTAEALPELETIADLVRWAASEFGASDIFYGHGCDNAVDEALAIVLPALALEPGLPSELYAAKLLASEKRRIAALVRRRVSERIPAAYITNRAWFANLEFFIDERVLVPRSPIAELIQARFSPWIMPEQVERVLELGTGSGCIAIASAFAFPDSEVDAVDISKGALEVA